MEAISFRYILPIAPASKDHPRESRRADAQTAYGDDRTVVPKNMTLRRSGLWDERPGCADNAM